MYHALHTEVAHDENDYVTIDYGASPNKIIATLTERGIIQSPRATKLYLRFINRSVTLQAGDYVFPSPVSPLGVIDILGQGRKRTENLTILEGWTRFEIAEAIAKKFPDETAADPAAVLELMNDATLIRDLDPKATSLEGYLYPDTYAIEVGSSPREVIRRLVRQFREVWQPAWNDRARELGRSPREILIIASLIENESKVDRERPAVASVIYNRLRQQMPLGIDATNVYLAKMLGRWDGILHRSDLEIDHPYNTRKVRGLPPGPISSPSKSSIEAALYPAETDYLYYVLNVDTGDGTHHFYATEEGFFRGKARYQQWLREQ
ncbi:endolytic transglycosylase MltG [Lewinella sp. W8]|uniref:endolytic transglycosylase MltG n=1 Tax=Lewinella sp. W8 TaxID=2528208 RepID=UPI001067CD95|nr:endolytic transglycosylase MltG [Lewinella sp. W8]MTB50776.1 endolytic transglycosylase MltG [Lewinella sp. W8]